MARGGAVEARHSARRGLIGRAVRALRAGRQAAVLAAVSGKARNDQPKLGLFHSIAGHHHAHDGLGEQIVEARFLVPGNWPEAQRKGIVR